MSKETESLKEATLNLTVDEIESKHRLIYIAKTITNALKNKYIKAYVIRITDSKE